MGRPLKGSIRKKGNSWEATLPRRKGAKHSISASFPTEADAKRWVDEQKPRIEAGLDTERPARPERQRSLAAPKHDARALVELGRRWMHQRYDQLHTADAERAGEVKAQFENHIVPAFQDLIGRDIEDGNARVVEWVRAMAGWPADEPRYDAAAIKKDHYSRAYVNGLLWILEEVLKYAAAMGEAVPLTPDGTPAYLYGVKALNPRGKEKRKPQLVSIAVTAQIAAHLHVIHQAVLWLMRLAGLRISEVYGLRVANFVDDGEWGYLVTGAQAGRKFAIRNDDGSNGQTNRKEGHKTDAGFRMISLPHLLTQLLRDLIAAFHTDPDTGFIDFDAPLIPTVRVEDGGIAGFRAALKKGALLVEGASKHEDDYVMVIPHDIRKAYATDLAWTPALDRLVKRRAMGHRAGQDVFDLVYTLDDRLKEHMKPAALAVDRQIQEEGLSSLMMPTTSRPLYGRDRCRERLAHTDAALAGLGWQCDRNDPGWISADEAAAILGRSPQATRRLFPALIPAIKDGDTWRAREDDVFAFRDRHAGYSDLHEVAERLQISYHVAYQTMRRLELAPAVDDHTRTLLLADTDVDAIVAEHDRIAALEARAVPVTVACKQLRASHDSVHRWARNGRLAYDPETDASGKRYITNASIDAELARRGTTRPTRCKVADFTALTGIDGRAVDELVRAGHLVRDRADLTLSSVRRWATGYRPDLLSRLPT